jgi:hypothetical protein
MKNLNYKNIGIVNTIITNKMVSQILNETINDENFINTFFTILSESPILKLELKVLSNISEKQIKDKMLASKYIDDNIKLFELYTIDELNNEHKKLEKFTSNFLNENVNINLKKIDLYDNMFNLIIESVKIGDDVDVDKIHNSFNFILDYIITNDVNKSKMKKSIDENVLNIAINKFNDKYSQKLNDNDFNFLKKIISSDINSKKELFEEYKDVNLESLKVLSENIKDSKIEKSISKIKSMVFNPDTINNDLIKLYELNKNI